MFHYSASFHQDICHQSALHLIRAIPIGVESLPLIATRLSPRRPSKLTCTSVAVTFDEYQLQKSEDAPGRVSAGSCL